MTARRRARTGVLRVAAFGVAAVATVTLTQVPASGTFAGSTTNSGDKVTSAASFCAAAPTTLFSAGDAWVDQVNPTANYQSDLELRVRAGAGQVRRAWIRFDLPAAPQFCTLAAARLRFYNKVPATGRSIAVLRGDPTTPWTADQINWSNQPGTTGTAVASETALTTSTAGFQYWNVTRHVNAQYAGGSTGNNGLVLFDQGSTGAEQVYYDRQDVTNNPTLVLTWG